MIKAHFPASGWELGAFFVAALRTAVLTFHRGEILMKFRVIPFIGKIKGSQSAKDVSDQLETLINQGAQEGWEFVQINNVNIEVQPGCMAGIFGAKANYVRYDMAVFRKNA